MIAYHLDRSNYLKENSTLNLINNYQLENTFIKFENAFSRHGIKYLSQNFLNTDDYGSYLWEFALEYIRLLNYPSLPSRFQSIFACRNLEEINYWKTLFEEQGFSNVKTFKISSNDEDCFVGDANWFNSKGLYENIQTSNFENVSWATYLYYSNKYWSGEFTHNPHVEVLVKLPCTINELIIN